MEQALKPPKQIHQKTKKIFTALLESLGLNTTELARELSGRGKTFSQQLIATYVSGSSKSNEKVLEAIVARYPTINAHWLITGKGEPFPKADATDDTEPPPPGGGAARAGASSSEAALRVVPFTMEELLEQNAKLRHENAIKDGRIAALEENQGWLRSEVQRKKTDASPNAAGTMLHVSHSDPTAKAAPIGPRFDNEAVMFIAA